MKKPKLPKYVKPPFLVLKQDGETLLICSNSFILAKVLEMNDSAFTCLLYALNLAYPENRKPRKGKK